jgi:hypothetical protein
MVSDETAIRRAECATETQAYANAITPAIAIHSSIAFSPSSRRSIGYSPFASKGPRGTIPIHLLLWNFVVVPELNRILLEFGLTHIAAVHI